METTPDDPPVYWAQSCPAEMSAVLGRSALNHGSAASVDPDRAIMKAVGETIERYCAAFYDDTESFSAPMRTWLAPRYYRKTSFCLANANTKDRDFRLLHLRDKRRPDGSAVIRC